ncbi:hypothetical protein K0M31_014950 [Melipona bicolor]|uniref:Uncharacterized protein n=1 Tax=Melipona bicolor TaxID=60889 RepID=A0AA40KFX1_9HYME|nr:hypothetical protein K0M31_014950 [Melipona bicolor]
MDKNEKFGKLPLLRKNGQVEDDDGIEICRARTYMQGGKGSGTGLPCATLYVRTAIEIVVSIFCTDFVILPDSFLPSVSLTLVSLVVVEPSVPPLQISRLSNFFLFYEKETFCCYCHFCTQNVFGVIGSL